MSTPPQSIPQIQPIPIITQKKRPRRAQHSFVVPSHPQVSSISKMQKSLMLLRILKTFEAKILTSKECQLQHITTAMTQHNLLLQQIYERGKQSGLFHKHSLALISPTPNLRTRTLTSQIVLDKLDINSNEKQLQIEKENSVLENKIEKMEKILQNANQKKTLEQWNIYLAKLGERVEKRNKQLIAREEKEKQRKPIQSQQVSMASVLSETESITSFRSIKSGDMEKKLAKQCENSVNNIRKSIQIRNMEMSTFLSEIKDYNINTNYKNRKSWKREK